MQTIFRLLFVLCVATLIGCGNSAADSFDAQHGGQTMTPHGKVVAGSTKDVDGKIQFQTEDGTKWEATPLKDANGALKRDGDGKVLFGEAKRIR